MTPKAEPKALVPHPEDFDAWCAHPITAFVAEAWRRAAEAQRDVWTGLSWGDGKPDPEKLIELRTRADAYMAFLETGLDQYAALFEDA